MSQSSSLDDGRSSMDGRASINKRHCSKPASAETHKVTCCAAANGTMYQSCNTSHMTSAISDCCVSEALPVDLMQLALCRRRPLSNSHAEAKQAYTYPGTRATPPTHYSCTEQRHSAQESAYPMTAAPLQCSRCAAMQANGAHRPATSNKLPLPACPPTPNAPGCD